MKAYTATRGLTGLGDFLHSEYDPTYNTDKAPVLAGSGGVRTLPALCLVAIVFAAAPAVTAGANVGTGNGSIGSPTADVGAMPGVWQVVVVEPGSNVGTFEVIRPDGSLDGTGTVAVAYNGGINFTLADGATDFVAGDRVPVTVSYPTSAQKLVQWDPAGVNGSQVIKGVNCFAASAEDGVDGDEAPYLARGPLIGRREALVWHAGVTAQQKLQAYAALSELGIETRVTG